MPYTVKHNYIDQEAQVSVRTRDGLATVRCANSGSLSVRSPGKFMISKSATYSIATFADPEEPDGGGGPHRPIHSETKSLPLTLEIKTPDDQPFTADHVTRGDLDRFRDLRGTSQGSWAFSLHGTSEPIAVGPEERTRVSAGKGRIRVAIEETVISESAPPLVDEILAARRGRQYSFDLYRVGTFTAFAASDREMILRDPDRVTIAIGTGRLAHPVTLETLGKSRDAEGKPRPWSLEARPYRPFEPFTSDEETNVWASVIESARIRTSHLQERIDHLIGVGGSKISIFGEIKDSDLLARLKILDPESAETADMLDLLDGVIKSQNPEVSTTIEAGVAYTLILQLHSLFS